MEVQLQSPHTLQALIDQIVGVMPDQSHKADAYQDWINRIVVHVNEADQDIVSLEGHYKHYEHSLQQCATVAEANILKSRLDTYLAAQPDGRARQRQVAVALRLIQQSN